MRNSIFALILSVGVAFGTSLMSAVGLASDALHFAAPHASTCPSLLGQASAGSCPRLPLQSAKECDFARRYAPFTKSMSPEDWRGYSSLLIREWLKPFDQLRPSPILAEQMRGANDQSESAYWETRKVQVEEELRKGLELPPINNEQLLETAWMVAHMYAISELPADPISVEEYRRRWGMTRALLSSSVDKVLQDPEFIAVTYWSHSRLGRTMAHRRWERVGGIILPVIESMTFLDMNHLLLQGVLPLELRPVNRADFDYISALQLGGFAHDEIHTNQVLKIFDDEGLAWLRRFHDQFVKTEIDPFQRRLKEYVFWFLWHEDQSPYLLMRQVQEGRGIRPSQSRALDHFLQMVKEKFDDHAKASFQEVFPNQEVEKSQLEQVTRFLLQQRFSPLDGGD